MSNANAVIAPASLVIGQLESDPLESSRAALVQGIGKTGDLIRNYAAALELWFDQKDTQGRTTAKWYELIGKEKKPVKAEREKFVALMVERGFAKPDGKPSATVDTYWQRVKEASGYVPRGRVQGSVDVDARTVSDLQTVINRILKAEEDGKEPNASQYKAHLIEVFESLGGDVDKLG